MTRVQPMSRPMRKPTSKQKRTRSTFEEKIKGDLTERGVAFQYEPLTIRYTPKPRTYKPDFVLPNGIIIETKGWFTSADRTKHLLIKEQRPDLDIRFVFQRAANLINPKSKTTYAMWCEQHGFKWAWGRIPEEWTKEKLKRKSQKK